MPEKMFISFVSIQNDQLYLETEKYNQSAKWRCLSLGANTTDSVRLKMMISCPTMSFKIKGPRIYCHGESGGRAVIVARPYHHLAHNLPHKKRHRSVCF
jgi:hypothetical protein